jgi:two-component system, chemotaxis family, chemotaxis protein CheY
MAKQPRSGLETLDVLVIDDHKGMREIIWTVLTGLGIVKISEAADIAAAEAQMKRLQPDIIFLDWMLQGEDGLHFVRHIRALPDDRNPFVPIILVTGHAEYARVVEARDAGVTEFLVKPLTGLAVAQRLETVIHHPRSFVRAGEFTGPDRRRRARSIDGPDRRGTPQVLLDQDEIDEVMKGGSDDR